MFPACSLAAACPCDDAHNQNEPLFAASAFHPPGDLLLLIELDGGKLLCCRSMGLMSDHLRDFGQNNPKVLLTPPPRVNTTPFPSFQSMKKIWEVLPRLQITPTHSQGLESHKLEILAAMYLLTGLCHNVDIGGVIKLQKILKHNCPSDDPAHVHPHGDAQHLR